MLIRISTRTRRNDTAEKPAELVTVYLRVYCPGKQVPSVKDEAVHLHKKNVLRVEVNWLWLMCSERGGAGKDIKQSEITHNQLSSKGAWLENHTSNYSITLRIVMHTHLDWPGIVETSSTDIRAQRSAPVALSKAAAAHEDVNPLLLAAVREAQGSRLNADSWLYTRYKVLLSGERPDDVTASCFRNSS